MVTKTLTITEDAYKLLLGKKLEDESFSEEIQRLLSIKKTRSLDSFFGMLTEEEGSELQADLLRIKQQNKKLVRT